MIGRGKIGEVFLYEITEQDLLLPEHNTNIYHVGNVLMFTDKKAVTMGSELARADDLATAKEYLQSSGRAERAAAKNQLDQADHTTAGGDMVLGSTDVGDRGVDTGNGRYDGIGEIDDAVRFDSSDLPVSTTKSAHSGKAVGSGEAFFAGKDVHEALSKVHFELQERNAQLGEMYEKLMQRDELLRDISESLSASRQENELLQAQLSETREQLTVGELIRNELVDDLQNVSKDTHSIESTLEQVFEEKYRLEQELAEKITDLVDLNLQNDDLRMQLYGRQSVGAGVSPSDTSAPTATSLTEAQTATTAATKASGASLSSAKAAQNDDDQQILTMSSGKRIHVLHEFPEPHKAGLSTRILSVLFAALRILGIAFVALLVLAASSIIATAQINDISFGEALDLLLNKVVS